MKTDIQYQPAEVSLRYNVTPLTPAFRVDPQFEADVLEGGTRAPAHRLPVDGQRAGRLDLEVGQAGPQRRSGDDRAGGVSRAQEQHMGHGGSEFYRTLPLPGKDPIPTTVVPACCCRGARPPSSPCAWRVSP